MGYLFDELQLMRSPYDVYEINLFIFEKQLLLRLKFTTQASSKKSNSPFLCRCENSVFVLQYYCDLINVNYTLCKILLCCINSKLSALNR